MLKKLSKYNIILASGSPRRQELLKSLGVNFEIRLKKTVEKYPLHLKEHEITDFLADLKSKPFTNELKDNDILITSDTIVCFKNKALEKPKNFNKAYEMLKEMSGNTHKVITSISIKNINFQKVINDTTIVKFKKFSKHELKYYIKNYKPYDKAGGYGIQEWIGKIGVKKIKGSYFNVMGLPVHKLYKELIKL